MGVMNRDDLHKLSKEELIELVLRLQRPPKTSRTSSKPPSTDQKANKRASSKPGGAKPGHKGQARELSEAPDVVVDHRPNQCSKCGHAFGEQADGDVIGEYDAVDLPEIRLTVTRHRRLRCSCPGCGARTKAPAPKAASKSPFGPKIAALAVYLKSFQMASYQRLQGFFADVFGLKISQGGLANLLSRSSKAFEAEHEEILARLRQAEAVASDETGMRIEGVNGQQWVFRSRDVVVHKVAFSRGAQVAKDVMDGHTPTYWTSDRYCAQQGHGKKQQTCLAHLARDIERVFSVGDERLGLQLKRWISDVFSFAKRLPDMAQSTLSRKVKDLERRIDAALATSIRCDVAAPVLRKIANARDQLFVFTQAPELVEPTNNACERALRPAVVARKVTNGFRALWGAKADAIIRTVVDTNRLSGRTPYQTIRKTLLA